MAISVVLRRESNEEVDRATVGLTVADLVRLTALVPMLRWVDAYGNTIFNARQIHVLKEEVSAAAPKDEDDEVLLAEIARLCELGGARPHRYLWFIGD